MGAYLTAMGRSGQSGHDVTRTVEMAMKYAHDILMTAAERKLDFWMLCDSLQEEINGWSYRGVTGKDLAESIRHVLEAGRDVSIFIWNDPSKPDVIPPSTRNLITQNSEGHQDWGSLTVRASGTPEGADKMINFMLATNLDSEWFVRIDAPQLVRRDETGMNEDLPGVVFRNSRDAQLHGRELLQMFKRLESAVDAAEQARQPAYKANAMADCHEPVARRG